TIAIEAGAHFEGSVKRTDDPLGSDKSSPKIPPAIQSGRKPQQVQPN
ncbi:MAG: polymer-forming cytoskeletal protein, partial [Albidovulum sp.]|nr:polymer-forming cytoskeletal protein [Albidovulum sp.]